jgi:RNA polymerase sigma-54 factor
MHTLSIIQSNQISQRQHQQLLINLAMKQAFVALQLPLLELSTWVQKEIENNPAIETDLSEEPFPTDHPYQRHSFQSNYEKKHRESQEELLIAPISLYEHLMQQAPLVVSDAQDLRLMEIMIGHLDHRGYLDIPLQEVAPQVPLNTLQRLLHLVQTLDPPGIGATNLQECLLLQLKSKQKENGLAAQVITHHFDQLLANRLPQIAHNLSIPLNTLIEVIQRDIAPLDIRPGNRFDARAPIAIIPDMTFLCFEGRWTVEINQAFLPRFYLAPTYEKAWHTQAFAEEESTEFRRQLAKGKWLKRIIQRRNQTLHRIGEFLLEKQQAFFDCHTPNLVPLTMQETARELGLHESTVARAVANKYLACPLGVFALKSFFNQGLKTDKGSTIANRSLRALLAHTIKQEDKLCPFSDEQLAKHFKKRGIPCARRTITKYRKILRIASAAKRRRWR